jgi:transposase
MDSDRRSAQVERLEVVDTGRRRRWSEDEKLKIVLESLADCKIGEDVTETLELVPRQWKVIQHVREKLVCRVYTLIATAKLNDIDPQAWLADVLARLPDHPARSIHELLPWNWRLHSVAHAA